MCGVGTSPPHPRFTTSLQVVSVGADVKMSLQPGQTVVFQKYAMAEVRVCNSPTKLQVGLTRISSAAHTAWTTVASWISGWFWRRTERRTECALHVTAAQTCRQALGAGTAAFVSSQQASLATNCLPCSMQVEIKDGNILFVAEKSIMGVCE
jgi:hypothetical protein